ncbi:hypothetical protein K7X08_025069 [Anisodus acutangulus]|uniref:Uncharacterized protein n=1 Tax=Anisodus acutangulus TaxID=402998 RepID=A0A9Q1RDI8_9SOLA|nr:hypothetical protein K7X08_025069 [Anisodus acutangulus]
MLDLLLPLSTTPSDISNLDFQIEAYITRENDPQENNLIGHVQTIVFKQNPKDSPISAALGNSSWLWLGAIISSSFVMFLLLLGLITRYSIYPVERDGKIYHYSGKIIWDMFLVCASVFIATSVIFMWQKRENETEGKQIQNVEIPSVTNSPAGNLCGTELELESLPQQSIVQATKVHYGGRPDLKIASPFSPANNLWVLKTKSGQISPLTGLSSLLTLVTLMQRRPILIVEMMA